MGYTTDDRRYGGIVRAVPIAMHVAKTVKADRKRELRGDDTMTSPITKLNIIKETVLYNLKILKGQYCQIELPIKPAVFIEYYRSKHIKWKIY